MRLEVSPIVAFKPVELKVYDGDAVIRNPENVNALFEPCFDMSREQFYALYLNTRHKPIAEPYMVSLGCLNASMVHPRELFRPAIIHSAAAVIIAHNHPSGDPEPSADDLELTTRLDEAAKLLGIVLLDHLIYTPDDHTSLREYGWPEAPDSTE